MVPQPGAVTWDVVDALHQTHPGAGPHENRQIVGGPAAQRLVTTITELRAVSVPVHGQVAAYQRWARAVARFSFETYHLYTEPGPPPP